jgi:hypothetical protein
MVRYVHETIETIKKQVDRLDKPGFFRTKPARRPKVVRKEENIKFL